MKEIINKSMDFEDFDNDKLDKLKQSIIDLEDSFCQKGYKISSWYGNIEKNKYYDKIDKLNRGYHYFPILPVKYDKKYPSFLVWEIYSVLNAIDFKPGDKVLDIGGACSLFSFYLATKGLEVVAIDINKKLIDEANRIASSLGLKYKAIYADAEEFINNYTDKFNVITSICVFEHIESEKRKRIIKNFHKLLLQNGKVALTFDYKNPSKFVGINSPDDVKNKLACSDYLKIMGNQKFYDNNKNYLIHPFYHKSFFIKYKIKSIKKGNFNIREFFKIKSKNDYSFGCLFMEML